MAPVPIFIALADPTRCRIIELLRAGPSPVHRLAAEFDISRPAISRHLRVLREAGLIREESRAGKTSMPCRLSASRQCANGWTSWRRLRFQPKSRAHYDRQARAGTRS